MLKNHSKYERWHSCQPHSIQYPDQKLYKPPYSHCVEKLLRKWIDIQVALLELKLNPPGPLDMVNK